MQSATEAPPSPGLPPPVYFFGVSLTAAAFFALWSVFVFRFGVLPPTDERIAEYWYERSLEDPGPLATMIFLTEMGGVAGMVILTAMGALWQTALRARWLAVAWIAIAASGGLINSTTKSLFDRPRPPHHADVVHERNYSYPSGHAMGSTIGYGFLAYTLLLAERRPSVRVALVLLLLALVGGIGFSRIFLRAHWFSDVIAGWTIGLCWLTFCLGWLERYRCKQGS